MSCEILMTMSFRGSAGATVARETSMQTHRVHLEAAGSSPAYSFVTTASSLLFLRDPTFFWAPAITKRPFQTAYMPTQQIQGLEGLHRTRFKGRDLFPRPFQVRFYAARAYWFPAPVLPAQEGYCFLTLCNENCALLRLRRSYTFAELPCPLPDQAGDHARKLRRRHQWPGKGPTRQTELQR